MTCDTCAGDADRRLTFSYQKNIATATEEAHVCDACTQGKVEAWLEPYRGQMVIEQVAASIIPYRVGGNRWVLDPVFAAAKEAALTKLAPAA